ncbi:glutamyl aminopeptidase-like [Saccostrea echinata]|uniref:glutamyl aminopeptidase-like n=1 Tax=Saccostrea echinata TaxID=191078 RepID=UPI002A7FD3B2|nr:glutamyl aminopeptidase-like [Saccostrea echinata]
MQRLDMDSGKQTKTNKRLVYFLVFLVVALPIVVGVLVWHFTNENCDKDLPSVNGESDANTGNKQTTTPGPIQTTTPGFSETEPWKNLRLPRYVMPIHYDITLYPDIYNGHGWFYGNESVEIQIYKDTKYILIHKNYMNITSTSLRKKSDDSTIEIKNTFYYEQNQFWVIETRQSLLNGSSVILDLSFDGSLTRAIVGFYKSKYVNSITKETRYLATSKFEPVDARRAFPCFDEPNIKANFTVHLVHQDGYTALSNMPEEKTEPWTHDSTLKITSFQESVKMSTYLVCFIVCDFKYLERTTKFGTKVRTFATPDRYNQTEFSLEVAIKSMELYQDLFNVSYPLPKQDMIAIPDFVSGAMEHWGLITYRETNILYDPQEASPANKQRVAVVVAHEISHQWFGNIVTMDWWDDLWLNEGFASFMEYLGANVSEPTWEMMEQFVTEDVQPVMVVDSVTSSHPIVVNVNNPNQINEVFDSISYSKGSAIIGMLEAVMGQDKFFLGVGNYLKAFKWGNAKTDDLWNELNKVNTGGFGVKDMMDTWTRQMGFPYINVTMQTQGSKTIVSATQSRFLADKSTVFNPSESPFGYKWYVYLDYMLSGGGSGHFWINRTQDQVTFDVAATFDSSGWIKFNRLQKGFYRVNYPENMWSRFSSQLQTDNSKFSNVDKAGLIDDAFNLARAGYIEYSTPLNLIKFLDTELNHLPWESAYSGISYITEMLQTGASFSLFRDFILKKSRPVLTQIGWDDTGNHLQKLMRVNLISLTCGMGDKDCLNNATNKFRKWLDQGESVTPNIRSIVYKYGMQNGGSPEDWDKMWNKYKTETVPQEQIKLLYGMSKTPTVWLLVRYLEYTKREDMVRSQDFFTVVQYIAQNPVGNKLVWDWVRSNWEYLVDRFTTYSRSLGRLVPRVISNFNTEFELQQVEAFFTKYPDAGAGARGRQNAIESIKANIQWKKNNEKKITDWLCQNLGASNQTMGC